MSVQRTVNTFTSDNDSLRVTGHPTLRYLSLVNIGPLVRRAGREVTLGVVPRAPCHHASSLARLHQELWAWF
jgi:hypothetical protein